MRMSTLFVRTLRDLMSEREPDPQLRSLWMQKIVSPLANELSQLYGQVALMLQQNPTVGISAKQAQYELRIGARANSREEALALGKAAVESLTPVFAKELRGRQITVHAVAPGPVATELFMHGKSEEQVQHYAKMPPLERLGQPEDIASIVSFLLSPAAGWVNGQILRANGGLV